MMLLPLSRIDMRCSWFFLLLFAMSGSFPASATEPTKSWPPKPWVSPEPVHTCKTESIRAATPTADFIDNKDGTVTHRRTGLTWMRCSLGQSWDGKSCIGKAGKYVWQKALLAAPDLNAAGGYASGADWRLPNIKELDSIAETQCLQPSINIEVFPATPPDRFWSSTLSTSHEFGYAWFVRFDDAYVDDGLTADLLFGEEADETKGEQFAYHVRLVRGGTAADSFDKLRKNK